MSQGILTYPAVLTREGQNTLISFPDCPGCETFSQPGEDMLGTAQDALTGWLEQALEKDEVPPQPSADASVLRGDQVIMVPVVESLAQALKARWNGGTTDRA